MKPRSGILDFGWNRIGGIVSALMLVVYYLLTISNGLLSSSPIRVVGYLVGLLFPGVPFALLVAGVVTVIAKWYTKHFRRGLLFNGSGWFLGAFFWSVSFYYCFLMLGLSVLGLPI